MRCAGSPPGRSPAAPHRNSGSTGLAQRTGYRTAQELVRVTTGSTARDAATSVRVGLLTVDAVAAVPTQPWLQTVGQAVAAGTRSAPAADAIRFGRRDPSLPTPPPPTPQQRQGNSPPQHHLLAHPAPRTSTTNAPPSECTHKAAHSPNCSGKEPDEGRVDYRYRRPAIEQAGVRASESPM